MSASLWSGLAPAAALRIVVERAGGERIAQRRVAVHGDDAVADHHAVALLAVGDIACEFHCPLTVSCL